MLSGRYPFYEPNEQVLYQKIINCEYNFNHPIWEDVSFDAKDLIMKLLNPDPKLRFGYG